MFRHEALDVVTSTTPSVGNWLASALKDLSAARGSLMGRTKIKARAVLAVLVASLSACSGEYEYVYTRPEPAVGRRGPTTFTIRLRLDKAQNQVIWDQRASDDEGIISQELRTLRPCTFLSDDTWACDPFVDFGGITREQVEMRDGRLKRLYWGTTQEYVRRRVKGR